MPWAQARVGSSPTLGKIATRGERRERDELNRAFTYFALALTTFATLVLELGLTRLFSATIYYHFAFMAISLALLGSGASGVLIYVAQRGRPSVPTGNATTVAAGLFSLTTL